MFNPVFTLSPKTANALMQIEASRRMVDQMPVTSQLLDSLRKSARLLSTHYSTRIEGNRLTREEVEAVARGSAFPNRKRDEREVRNYFLALDYLDELVRADTTSLDTGMVQRLHGCVMEGKRRLSPWRDGQNVIRESDSGSIVYMPPEAKEVPSLMEELVDWIRRQQEEGELPVPVIAGIAHYQFATIHPYYDGNGRTARLLTSLILHLSGYGLKGIYSLEEYYARNLPGYYGALDVGESHNYHLGRAEADITAWIEYFCLGMADAFSRIQAKAESMEIPIDQSTRLRELDQRQKLALTLFARQRFAKTKDIAHLLGLQPRTAFNVCRDWVDQGFLIQHGERKSRQYELAEKWVGL